MSSERESLPINIFHLPFSLQSNHTPPPTHGASIFSFFDIFWHFFISCLAARLSSRQPLTHF